MDERPMDDWTAHERRAIDGLPREEPPPRKLRDRIAATLRTERILRPRRTWQAGLNTGLRYALVASVFFAFGALASGWRPDGLAGVAALADDFGRAALVQQTGSAYVAAVRGLSEANSSADASVLEQGREAAMATLRGAAEQVNQLGGHTPETEEELRRLRERRGADSRMTGAANIIWY